MSDTATTTATTSDTPAPVVVTLEGLDLAALLCSRVCHDLISPVGAVVNGIEVMEDDADEQTKQFAIELIKKSATTASARLQFCRIAFGAAGSAGASIDTGDAEGVARGMMEDDKTKLTWKVTRVLLPKNRVKLLLNLLLMAGGTIPRGGNLTVEGIGEGDTMGFKITSTGMNARIPQTAQSLVAGDTGGNPVDAHAIQPFYTGMLARACGLTVTLAPEGESIALTAR
jgi:histidine phosphotransferase ChpT